MKEKFDVDETRRETERMKINSRPTSMRRADGEVAQILNYQTTIFLKRKYPEMYDIAMDALTERLEKNPPKFQQEHYKGISGTLGQILMYDAHIDQQDTKRTGFKARKRRIIT